MDQAGSAAFLKGNSCTDLEVCRKVDREQFRMLAEHWNDKIKIDHDSTQDPKTGMPVWRSADLLTSYSWKEHESEQKEDTQLMVTAKRTVCKPTEAPYSPRTPVRCTTLFSAFNGYSKKWDEAQETSPKTSPNILNDESWAGTPEVVSSYALEEVARRSNVVLMPGLVLEDCSKVDEFEGVQATACMWSEPSSMQSFSIQLARPRFQHPLSEMDKVPWTLAGWDGMACAAAGK